MAKATKRAPGGACPTAPLHRGVYKDRAWWRVGNHGPRFSSYGAAVAHLEVATGKSADQLLRACRATASHRTRWAATVYRGVLQRGTLFRSRLYGRHCGYAASLEDAVQLLLADAEFQARGVTRENLLLRRGDPHGDDASAGAHRRQGPALEPRSRHRLHEKTTVLQGLSLRVRLRRTNANIGHGVFTHLPVGDVLPHLMAMWSIYKDGELLPQDRLDLYQTACHTAPNLFRRYTALHICYIGLKYGPWRQALLSAMAESGFHEASDPGTEPVLTRALLRQILRTTCCFMHDVRLAAWANNVGRNTTFRSGGVVFMKTLHIVARSPTDPRALHVGDAGSQTCLGSDH